MFYSSLRSVGWALAFAQTCLVSMPAVAQVYTGWLSLSSQAQIDAFKYTEVDGSGSARRSILSAPGFVCDIEVVPSLGKIYFSPIQSNGGSSVWRANLDGSVLQSVVSRYNLDGGLAIDDRGASRLPVELTTFRVVTNGNRATLIWSTASETNNAGFEIHHAPRAAEGDPDGDWIVVGFVDGAGTTERTTSYEYEVSGLDIGPHRFRPKQIDYDGTFGVSPEVEAIIEVPGAVYLGQAYPNPFNPTSRFSLAVSTAQPLRVSLHDVTGRLVRILFEGELPANRQRWITIDGADLASGVYWYRVMGQDLLEIRSVTLLK